MIGHESRHNLKNSFLSGRLADIKSLIIYIVILACIHFIMLRTSQSYYINLSQLINLSPGVELN